ncbi:MAG: hypothetical protein O2816_09185 [Planctomycetota bacterium]|nr:hypothetical protein [Planctomycetota bacterium]
MKHLSYALCGLVLAALALPLAKAQAAAPQDPAPSAWEYKVVGVTDIHGSTLGNLKDAVTKGTGVLDKLKSTDEELAQSIEDVLNEHGQDGWEMIHATKATLIFKRPAR